MACSKAGGSTVVMYRTWQLILLTTLLGQTPVAKDDPASLPAARRNSKHRYRVFHDRDIPPVEEKTP
jgi:hypothetical protein